MRIENILFQHNCRRDIFRQNRNSQWLQSLSTQFNHENSIVSKIPDCSIGGFLHIGGPCIPFATIDTSQQHVVKVLYTDEGQTYPNM